MMMLMRMMVMMTDSCLYVWKTDFIISAFFCLRFLLKSSETRNNKNEHHFL